MAPPTAAILLALCGSLALGEQTFSPGETVAGVGGEYFRYTSTFMSPPTDEDRSYSIAVGAQLRCAVCAQILQAGVDDGAKHADDMESFLEAELPDEQKQQLEMLDSAGGQQSDSERSARRMLQHQVGCNKLFKFDVLLRNWVPQVCSAEQLVTAEEEGVMQWALGKNDVEFEKAYRASATGDNSRALQSAKGPWCLVHEPNRGMTEDKLASYDRLKESVFFACQNTVAAVSDELAEAVFETNRSRKALIRVCRDVAQCDRQKKRKKKAKHVRKEAENEL